MIFFESTIFWRKKVGDTKPKSAKTFGKKEFAYFLFLIIMCLFFIIWHCPYNSAQRLQDNTITMELYEERLKMNLVSSSADVDLIERERDQLLLTIEEKIVGFLYQIPDYSYISSLETYLQFRPRLLEQFPSAVPLEKGNYSISSNYGIRVHPISDKEKKHYGIDLATPRGKYVYASASGTIKDILYSKKGYGTHIIIKHRFGFETLYGHLNKVLVRKGQTVKQHEMIGAVGSTGSSTGYHLHYEILKNKHKIDPKLSFNLKNTIYTHLIELNTTKDGVE
ncbi:M23 family metallopeptidase [Arenibacter sp. BSSL-BM3]|uniref:M23 family metallopeptidase n=1 Tax=Arenibacter arenosicollis TaxID=2762274 RepID=A0ABR7QQE6_9FLAO|nr:M23 family metallopeptidase [Arenibacter arenosicollis]MBC8769417.1 M23 family metallopeptidase [Arenibacter arenosicollis]